MDNYRMARPKSTSETVTISMPREMLDRINEVLLICRSEGVVIGRSLLIRFCLDHCLGQGKVPDVDAIFAYQEAVSHG